MENCKRPPFGLTPRFIWLEGRVEDINEAIQRYLDANKEIPSEWTEERNKIIMELKLR